MSAWAISFDQFEARVMKTARERHVPVTGSFELTYRCNFDCVHCFQQDSREQNELTTERWCQLIDEVADAGCLFLTLTGGEALMHPGFWTIYEHAISRGLLITVFSNGSTLSEKAVERFKALPPRSIEVTLYGFSAETYEQSTGNAKHFRRAQEGVERAVAAGLLVQLKTMVFAETVSDFTAIRDYAEKLGVGFRYDTTIHATLKGSHAPTDHRISPEAIVALEMTDAKLVDNVSSRHAVAKASNEVYRCGAGKIGFNVAPDGHLQLCTLVRSLRFDLSQVSFHSAWGALGGEVQRRYDSKDRRCNGCELRDMCGTCPGIADLEKGDPESAIDHICETTHARASAILGRTLVPRWKVHRARTKLTVVA